MNLVPRPLSDWLKDIFERFVAFGVTTTVQKKAIHFTSDVMKANQEAAVVASDGIDFAGRLGESGVEAKRLIGELLEKGTIDALKQLHQVTTGQVTVSEGREALAQNPTSATSDASSLTSAVAPKAIGNQISDGNRTSTNPTTNGTSGQSASEQGTDGLNGTSAETTQPQVPVRRGPGRPRKNPLP
jgi:hypothetical protein